MYTPLEDRSEQSFQPSEHYDQLLSKESQDFDPSFRKSSKNRNQILLQIFLTLLLSILTFALGTWLGSYKPSNPSGRDYLEHVQQYCTFLHTVGKYTKLICEAPILKDVDTSLHYVTFNGSLMKENAFRQDAGPEVDAAWESIGVNCELPFQ
jgi:hypothetical protein